MKKTAVSPSVARETFGRRLAGLSRAWRKAIDHELAELKLTDATWRPLINLHMLPGPMRQKDLAFHLGLDGSSLVRLLDILCADGLVERCDDPADRRAKLLVLTPAGTVLAERVHKLILGFERRLLVDMADEDALRFAAIFDMLESRLSGPREEAPS